MTTSRHNASDTTEGSLWARIERGAAVGLGEYAETLGSDSPIASTARGRDIEMQALFTLYLIGTGGDDAEAIQSRVNTRRKFLGQWTDDSSPFTADEVQQARSVHLRAMGADS